MALYKWNELLAWIEEGFSPDNVWTVWQVLTKIVWWYEWDDLSWDVIISTQANNILTSWAMIWAWTQENYDWLSSYDNNTIYLII